MGSAFRDDDQKQHPPGQRVLVDGREWTVIGCTSKGRFVCEGTDDDINVFAAEELEIVK